MDDYDEIPGDRTVTIEGREEEDGDNEEDIMQNTKIGLNYKHHTQINSFFTNAVLLSSNFSNLLIAGHTHIAENNYEPAVFLFLPGSLFLRANKCYNVLASRNATLLGMYEEVQR
ncbi:unnamed protein product [Cylicocyclus nassatus]|uniref:Uncharacterized protein n=1 Tax=Cylicocyclus nassatus TaxID=53992 RepID=A0AA36M5I1_CYLNA|nr:unnamed protein product [Cylicocyclus nassatus]